MTNRQKQLYSLACDLVRKGELQRGDIGRACRVGRPTSEMICNAMIANGVCVEYTKLDGRKFLKTN